jgi:hypothetical protein
MAKTVALTDSGRALITNRIVGAGAEPKYVGWGTDGTPASRADTNLIAAAAESRVAGTSSRQTATVANDTYQVVGKITAAAPRVIREAALFEAVSGGNAAVRVAHDPDTLDPGEAIEYTFRVTF